MAEIYTSDIYNITNTVHQLQKKFNEDIDENTLMVSTYGYLGSQFAKVLQNSIIMSNQTAGESLLIKSKFEKTVLTNAIKYNIKNINAIPSKMNIMIGFVENELLKEMTNNSYTLSRDCLFEIGDFDFHLDHDIIIQTEKLASGEYIYTARYNINSYSNNFSNISSLYLTPPIRLLHDNDNFIFINCTIAQTKLSIYESVINSSNILENKTLDFDYSEEEQLAGFEVIVETKQNNITTSFNINPIYEGMPLENGLYCYYNYLDEDTIRLKFDSDSYNPKNGDKIIVRIYTTTGSKGNFKYNKDVAGVVNDGINNSNLNIYIKPSESYDGRNKRSIDELKEILPKESLCNNIIVTNTDIDTFFNNITLDNRLVFKQKRHNQIERLKYSYLLAKDNRDNIIPTNTLPLEIYEDEFDSVGDRIIINPNSRIVYNNKNVYAKYQKTPNPKDEFIYTSPFIMVINKDILSVSYYLNMINNDYNFLFKYINQNSFLQFISSSIHVEKSFLIDNVYRFTTSIAQNSNIDKNLVEVDENGNIISSKVKPVLVFTVDDTHKYYIQGEVTSFDKSSFIYNIEFKIDTDNQMNNHNQLRLLDVYVANTNEKTNIYLNTSIKASMYIYADLEENFGGEIIVPSLKDSTLCNIYECDDRIQLLYNYSDLVRSGVKVYKNEDNRIVYRINEVPLVRYSYIQDIDRCNNLIDYIQYRKSYISDALDIIEQGFEIDMKFYNTYGPSRIFTIGHDKPELLNKVNLSLNFIISLKAGVDKNIIELIRDYIKYLIEDFNNNSDLFIHMGNITSDIKTKYEDSLNFIEFTGLNNYSALYQYIDKNPNRDAPISEVPEFLCIDLGDDITPSIIIKEI